MLAVFYFFKPAGAQTAVFYPTTCLGGWQNTEKAAGAPEVVDGLSADYNDENSASVFNSVAEIFCGGFEGEIPADAFHERVILNFSWTLEEIEEEGEAPPDKGDTGGLDSEISPDSSSEGGQTLSGEETVDLDSEIPPDLPLSGEETMEDVPEEVPAEETQEPDQPETDPSAAEEPVSFLENSFYSVAYAQETEEITEIEEITETEEETNIEETTEEEIGNEEIVEEEIIEEENQETSNEAELEATNNDEEDLLSQEISDFSDTIIEVRYTLDGEEWKSLGYVEAINNEVNFELPIEEFGTLDDLKNVQIALRTLSTFDIPPKIYLDAMWLEVEYNQGLMPEEVIEEIPEIGEEVVAKIDARAEKIIFKRTPEGINILSPVAIEISATPEDLITEKSGVIGVPRQVMEVMNYWGIAVYTETENFVSECVATSLPLPIAVFDLEKGDYKTGISLGETKEECDAFNMAEYPIFEVFETANFSVQ